MKITRLSEGEKTLKFDMEDIDWKALDFFLEEVENGYYSKEELLNNENFLAMLAAVKYDKANWKKIPHYIKQSYLCKEFCLWVNPDITIDNMSPIQKYRAYLGLDHIVNVDEVHKPHDMEDNMDQIMKDVINELSRKTVYEVYDFLGIAIGENQWNCLAEKMKRNLL